MGSFSSKLLLLEFLSSELALHEVLPALLTLFVPARDLSLPDSEDIAFFDLEQVTLPVRDVGGSFATGKLDSELLVSGDYTFDLDAKATSSTDFSMLELASC